MKPPRITIAVPTLLADEWLERCLLSLERQTVTDFEVVVIDNSGGAAITLPGPRIRVIVNPHNVGFGAAANQALRTSQAPFLGVLNDDAVVEPDWLEALLRDAESHPEVGLFASRIVFAGTGLLDSAGMVMARDGSSKQRGHNRPYGEFQHRPDALLPSGCAAFYRRAALEDAGWFDEQYFLYCEDTDLGLRARWAGWDCRYVDDAVVHHAYSHSAGAASPLKAYLVERNRIFTVIKNFPARLLWLVPALALARYLFQAGALLRGEGKPAEFRATGHSVFLLPWLVARAHLSALRHLPRLLRLRWGFASKRRIGAQEFSNLLRRHSIGLRQMASQ